MHTLQKLSKPDSALKEIALLAAVLMIIGCGRNDANKAAPAKIQADVAENEGKVPADNQGKTKSAGQSEDPDRTVSEEKDPRKTDEKPRLGNERIKEQIALYEMLAEQYQSIKSKSKYTELKPTIDELEGKLAKVQEEWKLLSPALTQAAEKAHEMEWKATLNRYLRAKQKARAFIQ